MTKSRERATRTPDNDVSRERGDLYKGAIKWITKSINEGFYLEAISLEESLIADRLESYLTWLTKTDFSFKTLEKIKQKLNSEKDADLKSLVTELDQWRETRNKAAHEMVKIEDGKSIGWDDRMKVNQAVAKTGLKLFRKIDQQTRKLRTEKTSSML